MQAHSRQVGLVSPATIDLLLRQPANHGGRMDALRAELAAARREIDALRLELAQTRDSARLDHLTQIGNRRMLDRELPRAMTEAAASGEPLCVALADIDRFKALNDLYGHDVGDDVLKSFAHILRRNLKGRDTPIRFGGDEFALILPRTTAVAAATLLGQIRQAFEEVRMVAAPVTASFGLAEFNGAEDMAHLIRRADERLYRAKMDGRNRVRR